MKILQLFYFLIYFKLVLPDVPAVVVVDDWVGEVFAVDAAFKSASPTDTRPSRRRRRSVRS